MFCFVGNQKHLSNKHHISKTLCSPVNLNFSFSFRQRHFLQN